jgi:hypothetical protein
MHRVVSGFQKGLAKLTGFTVGSLWRAMRGYEQGCVEEIEEAIKMWYNVQQTFVVSEGDNHKEVFQVGIGIAGEDCKDCAR